MPQENTSNIELSIIATFHNEGIVAHKTILNIFQLVEPLKKKHINYEIILHIDKGDPDTLDYIQRYSDNSRVRIFKNSFGDPAESRNFCIPHAKGEYIAIFDGDDIMSKNWLIDGYRMLKDSPEPLVLHAEYSITFGEREDPHIWHMSDSRSDDEDTISMFTRNRWSAGVMMPKKVAAEFPYKKDTNGFGYEDWVFNMDTRHAGIKHKIVPSSVQFYRLRNNSTYCAHSFESVVTPYSEMFNTPRMQELSKRFASGEITIKNPNARTKRVARLAQGLAGTGRKAVMALPYVGSIAQRGANYANRRRGEQVRRELPTCVYNAWIDANQIDGEIWPDPKMLSRLWKYDSDFNYQTANYCRLISQIRKNPDYVFMPPVLAVGGTEKVLVNYINAFAELHPDWHIVVLAALPRKHPYSIPNNVDFVDFFGLINGMPDYDIDFLISRFIIQTKVKRLHLIHNELALRWARNHLQLLRHNDYKIYISQFMYEFNHDPRLKVGFIDPYIRDIYPAVNKIFTDNTFIAKEMQELDGFSSDKLRTHFQPVNPLPEINSSQDSANRPFRVLWASRVSSQKRPDLLKQIAKRLDPQQYTIDAYGRAQRPYNENYLKGEPNINYKGTYQGIESLDLSQYDAFLYTSQSDGLPNVLLEIASSGLPIVASNVGGVSDIINDETGYPIEMEDIDGYVRALKAIQQDPAAARKKAQKARETVQTRHSWKHFLDQVSSDVE